VTDLRVPSRSANPTIEASGARRLGSSDVKFRNLTRFLCLLPVFGAVSCDASSPTRLRLLTYNIHHGEGVDRAIDLPRLAKVIRSVNPDLVALQEVDNKTGRTGRVDQAAVLGQLTGMQHAFGSAMDFDGGQYGVAILSRYPILGTKTHALPRISGAEPRAALEVRARIGEKGPEIIFIGTHFDHEGEQDRVASAQYLNSLHPNTEGQLGTWFTADEPPMFLAGDLNAKPTSNAMRVLYREWTDPTADRTTPTFPCSKPEEEIDYILMRPKSSQVSPGETKVVPEPVASDHCPLLLVAEMR
jgi:endonuclease/exonuclease/phosphatase family metal-dependent hydrolase